MTLNPETLRRLCRKARTIWHQEGWRGLGSRVLHRRAPRLDDFDARHGTDTVSEAALWTLRIASADWIHGTRYRPVALDVFHGMMKQLPAPKEYTFIDLGCGKGRALILAAEYGFERIIGIEFSSELCAIAKRNLAVTRVIATIVCCSAADYDFPPGPSVVFLYNPFGMEILRKVIGRLHAGTFVVYVNPKHPEALARLTPIVIQPDFGIWRKT